MEYQTIFNLITALSIFLLWLGHVRNAYSISIYMKKVEGELSRVIRALTTLSLSLKRLLDKKEKDDKVG